MAVNEGHLIVRDFTKAEEAAWLRCRAVAFLGTNYFDDVVPAKPTYHGPTVELVGYLDESLAGVLDVAIRGPLATVETVATHPDFARAGVGRALLREALTRLPDHTVTLDAWTREDVAANRWYAANGFRETFRYLHVYARTEAELAASYERAAPGLTPVLGFFHAAIEHEQRVRSEFERVYVCRRYERALHR